jgi:hypothetical protein
MTALLLLGVINGCVPQAVRSVVNAGFWPAAFGTFDVSVVVLVAAVIGARFSLRSPNTDVDYTDWITVALYTLLLIIPHRASTWIGLTLFASYDFARGPRTSSSLAAASIFLAIAINEFWGAFLLQLFAVPLFEIDAAMATAALALMNGGGAFRDGNIIHTGQNLALVVATGCSSVAGMSAALLCWITVTRALRLQWKWSELPAAIFVCVSVVLLNVLRMALMGFGPQWFSLVHGPIGANVFNVAILGMAAATAFYTARTPSPSAP